MDAEIPGKPPVVSAGNKPAAAGTSSFIGAECLPKESSEEARDAWAINFTFLLTGVSEQNDLSALYRAAVSGVTLTALSKFAQSVDMLSSDSMLIKLIGLSGRTIRCRLKIPHKRLSSDQSARAIRGALLLDQAVKVIGSPELAEEWMLKPSIGLGGEKPIELLENSIGVQLVSEFLTRLEYGVYQ